MEAKATFVIALAREMVVDAGRGRGGGGAVVSGQLRSALGPGGRRLALPGGPLGGLGTHAGPDSVQAADQEEQQPLRRGRQGGERHRRRSAAAPVQLKGFYDRVRKAISWAAPPTPCYTQRKAKANCTQLMHC